MHTDPKYCKCVYVTLPSTAHMVAHHHTPTALTARSLAPYGSLRYLAQVQEPSLHATLDPLGGLCCFQP